MALTRTTVTDDDGSGTIGTVGNNSWLQSLFDTLDGRWSLVTITSTGTVNNMSIADANGHDADLIIFNNASDLIVTGIVAPSSPSKPGKPLRYICIGAGNVWFRHQNTGSTAANRLICIATSGDTPHAGGSGCGMLVYDGSNSRYRLMLHEQGAYIDYSTVTWGAGSTSTIVGFTGLTKKVMCKLQGRTLTVTANLSGTGSGAAVTFTVPLTPTATIFGQQSEFAEDAGSPLAGSARIVNDSGASVTISAFPGPNSSGSWTAGGARVLRGTWAGEVS